MCSYFIVGNKIFCFVIAFLDVCTFKGLVKFSKILSGVARNRGTDLEFLAEGLGKKGEVSISGWG